SLYEPFGIVALEGMAAGAPVVSSDAGGFKEVVQHDKTGTLSFANNAESLAWAILHVIRDPVRAQRLVEQAKIRLHVDFDWSHLAEQTIAVYDRTWHEFLDSYWAADTLWPVTPGAQERADQLKVREKAAAHTHAARARPELPEPITKPRNLLEHEERLRLEEEIEP
ncbi:MAG: glycosyltransferase, partial [Fimbriimonadales bacterium]